MELQQWIADELALLRTRLATGVIDKVPPERWHDRLDADSNTPVAVAWHTARHQDIAINTVVRGAPQVLDAWADRVGIDAETWRGLSESEDADLTARLDAGAVSGYLLAVCDASYRWLQSGPLPDLGAVPDSGAALASLGVPADRFDWLYAMWAAKPVQFFVAWEAVGHGFNHLGELVALRNRMGANPF